jgi:hypothetical protein
VVFAHALFGFVGEAFKRRRKIISRGLVPFLLRLGLRFGLLSRCIGRVLLFG